MHIIFLPVLGILIRRIRIFLIFGPPGSASGFVTVRGTDPSQDPAPAPDPYKPYVFGQSNPLVRGTYPEVIMDP
jgi:hypothetical protein